MRRPRHDFFRLAAAAIVVGAGTVIGNILFLGSLWELMVVGDLILYSGLLLTVFEQSRLRSGGFERRHELRFPTYDEWAGARGRAKKLFFSQLTQQQRRYWEQWQELNVSSPSGRVWRLTYAWSGNVTLIKGPGFMAGGSHRWVDPGGTVCVHIRHPEYGVLMPVEDNILGQKLMLESAAGEDEVMRKAI